MAKSTGKGAGKKSTGKRTTIVPGGDKRFARRDANGRFTSSDDVGRSLSQDRKKSAKTKVKPGYGDRGDQQKKSSGTKKATTKKSGGSK
jgi:hypothetical protein